MMTAIRPRLCHPFERVRLVGHACGALARQSPLPRYLREGREQRQKYLEALRWRAFHPIIQIRARRLVRGTARRYGMAAASAALIFASISSPVGMGNDGQRAYDLATRTWFGSFVGSVQAAGRPWYDVTTPSIAAGGAKGDGITNDTTAIAAASTSAGANGVLFFPALTYIVTLTLVPPAAGGQTWIAWNATLKWAGGQTTNVIANTATAGTTFARFRIFGLTVDCNNVNAVVPFLFESWQRGRLDAIQALNVSGVGTSALLLQATAGSTSTNNNGLNVICDFYSNNCGYGVRLSGNAGGTTFCTDNQFLGIHLFGVATTGISFVRWCDSNYWQGVNIGMQASGTGVVFNDSGTPTVDVGVYNETFYGITIDAFNGGGVGNVLQFNNSKQSMVWGLFISPVNNGWAAVIGENNATSYCVEFLGGATVSNFGNQIVIYKKGVVDYGANGANWFMDSVETVGYAAAYSPDATLGRYKKMTLTGAITVNAPVSLNLAGAHFTFIWTQDGVGGRVVTYNAIFKTGGAPAFVTTLSTVTIDDFISDGASYRLVSRITGQAV